MLKSIEFDHLLVIHLAQYFITHHYLPLLYGKTTNPNRFQLA